MEKEKKLSTFDILSKINVNDKVEKKEGLTYLSWAWAWTEFTKYFPKATYEIVKNEHNLPYFVSKCGVMVYTKVTVDDVTHEMWLPVMNSSNKSMKTEAYTYKTKYEEKTVNAFDMFDVNKTIMRCLTKNLAMFGLGLYIYAGEDLPEGEETTTNTTTKAQSGSGSGWQPAKQVPLDEAERKFNESLDEVTF